MNNEMKPLIADTINTEGAIALAEKILEVTADCFVRAYTAHLKNPDDFEKKLAAEHEERWMRKNVIINAVVDDVEVVIASLKAKAERQLYSKPAPKKRKRKRKPKY